MVIGWLDYEQVVSVKNTCCFCYRCYSHYQIRETQSIRTTWNPKQPFINGCFNWWFQIFIWEMVVSPNIHFHFLTGCLGFQIYPRNLRNGWVATKKLVSHLHGQPFFPSDNMRMCKFGSTACQDFLLLKIDKNTLLGTITYPFPRQFWRWVSSSQGGIC